MTILVQQLRAEIDQFKAEIERLEKSLKLVQSHAHTAYTRGRQAGIADQEHTAREAMVAMNLARDQMLDENERFTDLLEKAEQERDQLKAENAAFEEGCRKLAFQLSAGGYNADNLTAEQLIAKVQGGLDLFCESTSGRVQKVEAERDQLKAENAGLHQDVALLNKENDDQLLIVEKLVAENARLIEGLLLIVLATRLGDPAFSIASELIGELDAHIEAKEQQP